MVQCAHSSSWQSRFYFVASEAMNHLRTTERNNKGGGNQAVCSNMSTKNPIKPEAGPANATTPHGLPTSGMVQIVSPERRTTIVRRSAETAAGERVAVSDSDGGRMSHRAPTAGRSDTLLTPREILSRLKMTSADPTKWMRRTFAKHGVPSVHTCGKMRATEAQYQLLLERITCSPPAAVGRTATNGSVRCRCGNPSRRGSGFGGPI